MAPEAPVQETPTETTPAESSSNSVSENTAAPTKVQKKARRKATQKAEKDKPATKAKLNGHKPRPPHDDVRQVSKASDGALNPDQVRILRALRAAGRKELDRTELKKAVGIGVDKKYSGSWLTSLWALNQRKPPLMLISEYEPDKGERAHHEHSITADGRKILERAEKLAAKVE